MLQIRKAERQARKLRMAINGPAGSGKTYTSLTLASAHGGKILVIDSEQNSSTNYADDFAFDVLNLPNTSHKTYIEALRTAKDYDVVIVDSLSHAWESLVEEADRVTANSASKNSFQAWSKVTPIFKALMSEILRAPFHCICTMRVKTDYVMEDYTDSQGKKRQRPVKVGLAPIFRAGNEYEFDVIALMDLDNCMTIEKTRYKFLARQGLILLPGKEIGKGIFDWLSSGKAEEKVEADVNPSEYRLECASSKFSGKTLAEIQAENPGWMIGALASAQTRSALTQRDIVNIETFTNTTKEN